MQIQTKAWPFPMARVKLSDGPIRDAMERNRAYLLGMDNDSMLHNFRLNVGLPSDAEPMGGWEKPECELRGHFIGHYLSACALMYSSTGDESLKTKAGALVAELAKCQEASPAAGYHEGYLSAFPEEFIDRVEAKTQVWAPYYSIHKILAGLFDLHAHCGNVQALDVLKKMAGWLKWRTDRLSDEDMRHIGDSTEIGGIAEAIANLYAVTGDPDHLALTRRFDQERILTPLAAHRDELTKRHCNSTIPQLVTAAREYELTGDRRYFEAATYFWNEVTNVRCYATGGTSNYELWNDLPHKLSHKQLGPNDHECCCTHNLLKLTRHLFGWNPDARYGDYYERAYFNGILGTQHHTDGGAYMYYVAMRSGFLRLFGEPAQSYACCHGTGIESFAKLADSIYFQDDRGLYVNLFIASELDWAEKGVKITQTTNFPEEQGSRLVINAVKPVDLFVRIRIPYWTGSGAEVRVNGEVVNETLLPSTYFEISRTWNDGDRIEVKLPMEFHLDRLEGEPSLAAIMYGPIVLAGALGTENMTEEMQYGIGVAVYRAALRTSTVPVPALVTDAPNLSDWIEPVEGEPLTFRTVGVGVPNDVILKPFHTIYGERYAIYWKIYTKAEWEEVQRTKPVLPEGVIDEIVIGDDRSDYDHNFQSWGHETGELEGRKWIKTKELIRYEMDIVPDTDLNLQVTYFGDDTGCKFYISIEGEKLAVQPLANPKPGEFVVETYPIPRELLEGRRRIAVIFHAVQIVRQITDDTIGETTVEKTLVHSTPRIFGCSIVG